MRKVAWLTDLHLDFLKTEETRAFAARLSQSPAEAFIITGDIGVAGNLCSLLTLLSRAVERPIYFVLGNHDYYYGSIRMVRDRIAELCASDPNLTYLPDAKVVELAPGYALVGHDGWADLQYGDFEQSRVMLNDYFLIRELKNRSKPGLRSAAGLLAAEAAGHLREAVPLAARRFPRLFIATHVPPFREACWHRGQISNDEWLPHFSSKACGEAIRETMFDFPDCRATVLCGHTHGGGEAEILPNLRVLTGEAQYGRPSIQQIFEL